MGLGLPIIVAVLAALVVVAAPARADGTAVWDGNGTHTDNNGHRVFDSPQCTDDDPNPGQIVWILNGTGGSSATITINGQTFQMVKQGGGNSSFHFTSSIPVNLDTVTASATWVGGGTSGQLVISHGCPSVVEGSAFGVSKNASGTYDNKYKWTIHKTADTDTVYSAGGNASGPVNYTVTVSHDNGTVSNVKVTGTITAFNPNSATLSLSSISDQLSDGTSCTVDTSGGLAVPGGSVQNPGTTQFPYTCSPSSPASGLTNSATISWADQTNQGVHLAAGSTSFGPVAIAFTENTIDECVNVTDTLGGPLGQVCVGGNNPTTFTYSQTFQDPAGTCTSHPNTATFTTNDTGAQKSDSATVKDCQGADLQVSKTASPAFTRTYKWNIDKSVDNADVKTAGGAPHTFTYTVSVTHDAGTDSGWTVTGSIHVANPNDWEAITADVTDKVLDASNADDGAATCVVTGGTGVTIPASGSVDLPYTCTYASAPASTSETNKAIAKWDGAAAHTPHSTKTGKATFAFDTPSTIVDGSVDVTDTLGGPLGSVSYTDASPTSFTYPYTFTDPAGKCTSHDNTATFTTSDTKATGQASQTVQDCQGQDLSVTKTAIPAFTRTYKWHIDKSVDNPTVYSAGGGQSGPATYTVNVTHDSGTDSGWTVTGTITVHNPNDWEAVALTGVADAIDNGGTCAVAGDTTQTIVASGDSTGLTYTCTYASAPSPSAGTNTATATWDATAASTPDGSAQGQASADFGAVSPTVVDGTVSVSDTLGGTLGTVSYTDPSPTTFHYTKTFTDPAGTCTSHPNTATFTTNSTGTTGTASQTVKDCQGADLAVSKTASPAFNRKFTWNITKGVDNANVTTIGGAPHTYNYTVSVTHNAGTDSGWTVTGTITVTNPNNWEAITANVTDAVDNGGSCTVTGGTGVSIPKSGSVQLPYSCTYSSAPSKSNGTNTATATWDKTAASTPHGSASGTATFAFGTPTTIVDGKVSVTDTLGGNLGTVLYTDPSPTTFTYSKTFTDPVGACTSHPNTATFTTNSTGTTGSASQTVTDCQFQGALTPGYWKNHLDKTGNPGCSTLPSGTGCSNSGPFAKTYLPKSLGGYSVDTILKAANVFNAMNCSSSTDQGAVGCLAGHLLAAELNVANGSNTCISATIAQANKFLSGQSVTVNGITVTGITYTGPTGTYALSANQRTVAIALKTALDNYNNSSSC
jgi:hypothetical protein